MHHLKQDDTRDRIVMGLTHDLFDPDLVTSAPLPVVLIDPRESDHLERRVSTLDDGDLFPTLLLFHLAIEDGIGDRSFWEHLTRLLLDNDITLWYSLYVQFDGHPDFPTREALEANIRALYADVDLEIEDHWTSWSYLNRITGDVFSHLFERDPDYVMYRYRTFVNDAIDIVNDILRISGIWYYPAFDTRQHPMDPQAQASYRDVYDLCAREWEEAGVSFDPYPPVRKNPYKGGGFTCTN